MDAEALTALMDSVVAETTQRSGRDKKQRHGNLANPQTSFTLAAAPVEAQVALPLLPEVPVEEETEARTMELIQLQHLEKRTLVAAVVADTSQPLAAPAS